MEEEQDRKFCIDWKELFPERDDMGNHTEYFDTAQERAARIREIHAEGQGQVYKVYRDYKED